jgi:membrane fusion protein, multidrug efflux system
MKNFWLKHRKIILIVLAIGLALTCILVARLLRPPSNHFAGIHTRPPVTVTVEPVALTDKVIQVNLTGTVEGRKASAAVTTAMSGRIGEVYVTEGQAVKTGQPLVSIKHLISSSSVGRAAFPTDSNDPTAQSRYDSLLQEYNRYQKLYDQGAIPRRKLEESAARLQAAQDALAGTPPPVTTDITQPTTTDAMPLLASADGVVSALAASPGMDVQTGQQLMLLESGNEVRAGVQLQQKDLYLVHSGTPVDVTVENTTDPILKGQVESIYPGGNQLFRTQIKIDNTSGMLKAGMNITAHINTGTSAFVPTVPAAAVFEDQGLHYVYLAVDGKAVRQQVDIGTAIGDLLELTTSLPDQALVITSNMDSLHDGDAIITQ